MAWGIKDCYNSSVCPSISPMPIAQNGAFLGYSYYRMVKGNPMLVSVSVWNHNKVFVDAISEASLGCYTILIPQCLHRFASERTSHCAAWYLVWLCRYHVFLQLKKDILEGRLVPPFKSAAILASYAAQCEYHSHVNIINVKDAICRVPLYNMPRSTNSSQL